MLWSPPHPGVIFMAEVVTAETMGGLITLQDEPMQSNLPPPHRCRHCPARRLMLRKFLALTEAKAAKGPQ